MAIEAKFEAPVLVVDDDPKIQALVSTYLQREGLGVVTERVTDPAAIRPALERALAVTAPGGDARPALIEFITREETELSRPW